MAKVSVCIPAYNNPEGIRRLLNSIKSQSFTDYEVIITDDSKGGEVEDVVKEVDMPGLFYYKNEKSLGAASNWNKAVSYATGDYIKMMHHDDWLTDSDSLGQFVALLEEDPKAVLAFSGTVQVEKDRQFSRCISDEQLALITADWRNLFLGNYIGAPSATIYRKNREEYDRRLSWLVDVEYYMRLLSKETEGAKTADPPGKGTECYFAYTKAPLTSIGVGEIQMTERCIHNAQINKFEYSTVFQEFGLKEEKVYRDHLMKIFLNYKLKYKDIKPCQIGRIEFLKASLLYKWKNALFLAGVAKRKLFGNK